MIADMTEVKAAYQVRTATEGKKLNHQANIVRIPYVLPHPDPETTKLQLIDIGGYQCVVQKGSFKPGDLAVYIQPDSVVPQIKAFEFIWGQYVTDPATAYVDEIPERRRRITVRKFRGQWSEGLLLPVTDFPSLFMMNHDEYGLKGLIPQVGDDVSDLLGITHWNPEAGTEGTPAGPQQDAPKRRRPKTLKGWFHFLAYKVFGFGRRESYVESISINVPEYDVKSMKNYPGVIQEGEQVYISEKIHGSNARYVFLDGVMYAGSRTQWKSPSSTCIWRKALTQNPWIETWCKAHPGHVLYGEVAPTQKKFDYGFNPGSAMFFLFDIRTPEGEWVSYEDMVSFDDPYDLDDVIYMGSMVPGLYVGPYSKQIADDLVSGPSMAFGAKHIREGIVIKPVIERSARGVGRVQLKLVSNQFLERDSK